jgi:hypothetical protein
MRGTGILSLEKIETDLPKISSTSIFDHDLGAGRQS